MEVVSLSSRVMPINQADVSLTGAARREALSLAAQMQFDTLRQGQLGIVVNEAARNIEAHAGTGEIILTPWTYPGPHGGLAGIDLLALDKAKGIENLSAAMRDGYSTAGTAGSGLGAISRQSGSFQIYSASSTGASAGVSGAGASAGTALFARLTHAAEETESQEAPYRMGAISVPIAGESVCGDAWSAAFSPSRSLYIMADGLGHGPVAAAAAREAVRVFHLYSSAAPEEILGEIHGALAKTRGAAVSIAEILHPKGVVNYAGVGNIAAAICSGGKTHSLVSMNGTAGHAVGRIQQFSYSWEAGGMLILHSDGIGARWNLEQYPGLAARHPALVAGVLFRDFSRRRDDATILISLI